MHPLGIWGYRAARPGTVIQAAFSATPLVGRVPLTVTFENKTSGDTTSYAWDFNGDGVVDSVVTSPTHIYASAGTYSPRLTAYHNVFSVIDVTAISAYIVVCAPPSAPSGSFSYAPLGGTFPVTVAFTASTQGPLAQIYWDPDGDGDYDSFGSTTSFIYSSASTYTPHMILVGNDGVDTIVTGTPIIVSAPPLTPSTSVVSWRSWRTRI